MSKTAEETPSKELWTTVDHYMNDLLVPTDAALDAALESSETAGLPSINVSTSQGKLLHLLARLVSAKNILELGTLGAFSTIWLARGLAAGGRLVTIEADPKHAEVAKTNLERAGLSAVVELRLGKGMEVLPRLLAEGKGPFDLIFIDADKVNYPGYLTWSLKLSRPGTLIIADNVVRKGKVIEQASDDPNVIGMRKFLEQLATERRISATVMQTVGTKGYDGFAIGLVVA